MATYPVQITNNTNLALDIYTTLNKNPATDPPSTNPADYTAVYTLQGSVGANQSTTLPLTESLARLVIVRQSDQFPLLVQVANALLPDSEQVQVGNQDVTTANSGWAFYQSFISQPFTPTALEFSELVSETPANALNDKAASFFAANGYPGVSFALFSALGYWANNQLYAYPGTYYCYEPPSGNSMGFILPTTSVGTLTIAGGKANYSPSTGGGTALQFQYGQLTSPGADDKHGFNTTGFIRDLTWEGKPDVITWAFVGTYDGQQFIAQSYQNPQLPWYAVAYDMAYGALFTVQLAMTLDAAINLLGTVANGMQWLAQNTGKLISRIQDSLNSTGDTAGAGSGVGDAADPVNVDVDIDVDIDVDVDVDIDIDIDVDVDVDIDIDVDVDFIAVVDVDVDVDIDVDIDVVTDTETDIDIDVDVDIDTDVNVEPGALMKVVNGVGNWIMTKALPTLIEGAVIYVAFQSVGAIFQAWKNQDEKDIENLQPRQSTGVGVLVNYMLQDDKPVAARWQTFSQYVAEVQGDPKTVGVTISTLLQTGNTKADNDAANWRWSSDDENQVVASMAPYTGDQACKAFVILGNATYQGKPLPVKVGASVAMKYLAAQGA
ncbi:hypothetical protein [Pseudomonas mosselii]|uniref:hypothetical protein n=1 Tax=Pseudomonas mosselii TaxID=78327 RepID=UPI000BB48296|nr:hypothetical protein [Pseudomonas mosselii]ATB66664.1 hypothetical protein CLJ08_19320 [Pseudomonas mosselii]MDH1100228.1 hypothetical protein [Pseudomonas mosselii]MDH1655789.1 hypothetical protein [Pseudomonas mosselii]MDH1719364.1 hypothetical protein [Pseudomonas mosselii]MDH1720759.1 hypothetical protein [Pseudomonas mosselii]